MKRRSALSIAVALWAYGCRTGATSQTAAASTVEPPSQQTPGVAGPFEVAERWIASGGDAQVAELLRTFSQPVVERMHRSEDGFVALVIDATSGDAAASGEGILLNLREAAGAWSVVSSEIVAADYLWPTQ